METKDWLQLSALVALIIGWFINSYLNRKNEIAKKRLEFVLPALRSFIKVWYSLNDPDEIKNINPVEYKKLLIEVRENFQLYGHNDEIELFEQFVKHGTGKNINDAKAKHALEALIKLVRQRIRKELGIK